MACADGHQIPRETDGFRYRPPTPALVGVSGHYLKQWEPDWLKSVIARVDASPACRATKPDNSVVRPRRLDRRLSPDVIAEMVEGYRGGVSTNRLCERYGLSKGGLLKILQEHGVQMRNQPMTEEEIDWIRCTVARAGAGTRPRRPSSWRIRRAPSVDILVAVGKSTLRPRRRSDSGSSADAATDPRGPVIPSCLNRLGQVSSDCRAVPWRAATSPIGEPPITSHTATRAC